MVREEPDLSPEELWDFYEQNNCCETRYTFEQATSVIARSDVVVQPKKSFSTRTMSTMNNRVRIDIQYHGSRKNPAANPSANSISFLLRDSLV